MLTLSLVSWHLRKAAWVSVQPERAHEVATKWGEAISSLHRGYMDVQGARMHLKRKSKHVLSREELKHGTPMALISHYF